MKPLVIPVFIPGLGCPHQCIFCDQGAISGAPRRLPSAEEIQQVVSVYLASAKPDRRPRQLAFYGGTFTLLPVPAQERLLAVGRAYMDRGQIDSMRLSTRPDAVSPAVLSRLEGVRTVELGAQSFDDAVLATARRGHGAEAVRSAARLINQAGLELGLQLMCGLPGEDKEGFLASCRAAAELEPKLVRLYPTLVLTGTALAKLWRQDRYHPLALDEAVDWCRAAAEIFQPRGIRLARVGLPCSPGLEEAVLAGPYHPALGQLVRSALWRRRLAAQLAPHGPAAALAVEVAPEDLSDALGHDRDNLKVLAATLSLRALSISASRRVARGSAVIRST
ncbi:MAG: radical SAM protein [Pseudomonadota bacterium]